MPRWMSFGLLLTALLALPPARALDDAQRAAVSRDVYTVLSREGDLPPDVSAGTIDALLSGEATNLEAEAEQVLIRRTVGALQGGAGNLPATALQSVGRRLLGRMMSGAYVDVADEAKYALLGEVAGPLLSNGLPPELRGRVTPALLGDLLQGRTGLLGDAAERQVIGAFAGLLANNADALVTRLGTRLVNDLLTDSLKGAVENAGRDVAADVAGQVLGGLFGGRGGGVAGQVGRAMAQQMLSDMFGRMLGNQTEAVIAGQAQALAHRLLGSTVTNLSQGYGYETGRLLTRSLLGGLQSPAPGGTPATVGTPGAPGTDDAAPVPASDHPLVGRPAPRLQLQDFDGEPLGLGDVRDRVALLGFWTSADEQRQTDMALDHLDALARNAPELADDLVVFGIYSGDAPDAAAEFLATEAPELRCGIDAGGATAQAYRIDAFPAYVILDRESNVRWAGSGFDPETVDAMLQALEALTAEE